MLDNHEEYHQSEVVKVEGMFADKSIYVLIDLGSTHNYVTPKVAESCSLRKFQHDKSSVFN